MYGPLLTNLPCFLMVIFQRHGMSSPWLIPFSIPTRRILTSPHGMPIVHHLPSCPADLFVPDTVSFFSGASTTLSHIRLTRLSMSYMRLALYQSCVQRLIELAVEIVRGRENPGGRQQGYRGVGVRVLFSNPSYTLTPT